MQIISQSYNSISILSPAKINLFLKILGKRSDGYHEIRSIVSTLSLLDKVVITIKKNTGKKGEFFDNRRLLAKIKNRDWIKKFSRRIVIGSNNSEIPIDKKNNCYQAILCLLEKRLLAFFDIRQIEVFIDKKIPISAGLGGSSTNAAATLIGINKLLKLQLSLKELTALGNKIGSDLAGFLLGGITLVSGRGERAKIISQDLFSAPILLTNIHNKNATTKIYQGLIFSNQNKKTYSKNDQEKEKKLVDAIKKNDFKTASLFLENDLESSLNINQQELKKKKKELKSLGALNVLMSGSGGAIFGIFSNNATLLKAQKKIKHSLALPKK